MRPLHLIQGGRSRLIPRVIFFAFLLSLALHGVQKASAASAPDWLLADVNLVSPSQFSGEKMVMLRDEITLRIAPNGDIIETQRGSIRLLRYSKDNPTQALHYAAKSDDSFKISAWLIRQGKVVKKYDRSDWLDLASFDANTLYTDFRVKTLSPGSDCTVGDVFGWETECRRRQEPLSFFQVIQSGMPVLQYSFRLITPPNLGPKVAAFIRPNDSPEISADRTTWTWRINDLPALREEPWALATADHIVAFNIPPDGLRGPVKRPDFATWANIASWLRSMQSPAAKGSPEIERKVASLIAGKTTDGAKLQAITAFVQQLRYATNYANTGLGFGLVPNSAASVLKAECGDCKDKSTLLCAMFESAGFRARMVAVNLTTPEAIDPQWPSPGQFDHAIVAVDTPPEISTDATVVDPKFGRLTYVDPTAETVPFGWLPAELEGSQGLIVDDQTQGLSTLPQGKLGAWETSEEVTATIEPDGTFSGHAKIVWAGSAAAEVRLMDIRSTDKSRVDLWTHALGQTVRGVAVTKIQPTDHRDENRFDLSMDFAAPSFGQLVSGNLLIVKPDLLPSRALPHFSEAKRTQPVKLRSIHHVSEVRIALPASIAIEKLPRESKFESAYGSYRRSYVKNDDVLILKTSLTLNSLVVPTADFGALKTFIGQIANAGQQSVLLRTRP